MSKVAIIENSINEFFLSRKSFSDYLLKNFKLTVLVPYSTQHNFNYNKYNLCQYPLTRGERGITGALKTIWFLFWFFKKHKFDIIHTFKFEPNFYATLAARLAGSRYIINNINPTIAEIIFPVVNQKPPLVKYTISVLVYFSLQRKRW